MGICEQTTSNSCGVENDSYGSDLVDPIFQEFCRTGSRLEKHLEFAIKIVKTKQIYCSERQNKSYYCALGCPLSSIY